MKKINVKLMIDGNFTFHIHKYIVKRYNKHINWKFFIEFVKDYIKKLSKEDIQITLDAKYFIGTKVYTDDNERDFFYNLMDHAHISRKANKLKSAGQIGLKEDAVDVSLAVTSISDYYKARDEDRFEYFIILAGDTDFVPLITELRTLGITTVLVYMDFEYEGDITKTGQALLEEVDERINIQTIIDERVDSVKLYVLESHSNSETTDNNTNPPQITWKNIFSAMDLCKHYSGGYVLASELGIQLKKILGYQELPEKLKDVLNSYSDKLEFIQNPYQVKLKQSVFLQTKCKNL